MNSFKDTFKPQCPDFEPSDCPFACCVFLCLLAKHSRSKKKSEKNRQKDKRSLKHSTNSIQSNGNTTASTVQEDDLYGKSNLPTRTSSQTNLNSPNVENIRESIDNLPLESVEQPDQPISYGQLSDEMRRLDKNTQV